MSEVTPVRQSRGNTRTPRHLWYYAAIGVISGTAVILFAVLTGDIAGPALAACALSIGVFDRLARRFSGSPIPTLFHEDAIVYLVAVVVVVGGALSLVWVVLRNGNGQPVWLAWALAMLVVLVLGSGAWVEGRVSRRAASAT